ncbi:hypothetical protein sscle_03g030830 [Sclerotinia sclerotiorum 1980 UF-70]|nr:hypothetical protein sscle_03g030830 [Sclerotinia sclerotiorum 1980 UF-70]
MASNNTWPASVIPDWYTESSGANLLKTTQITNIHTRNFSSGTYIPEVGPHLSSEDLGPLILRIEVGSGKEPGGTITFQIHAKLLYTKIPVFENIIADTSQEILDPVKELPDAILSDEDPQAFKLLVGWIYTDKIDSELGKPASNLTPTSSTSSLQGLCMSMKLPILFKLCIMAEKYKITRLQDESINFLIKFMIDTKAKANPSCWLEVYKHTIPQSKLRLLISRVAVWQLFQEGGCDGVGNLELESIFSRSEELRFDVLALADGSMGGVPEDPLLVPGCEYYRDLVDG